MQSRPVSIYIISFPLNSSCQFVEEDKCFPELQFARRITKENKEISSLK